MNPASRKESGVFVFEFNQNNEKIVNNEKDK